MTYIERKALLEDLHSRWQIAFEKDRQVPPEVITYAVERAVLVAEIEKVRELPAADVAPVKHGRWEEKAVVLKWCEDDVDIFYVCSACRAASPGETFYCPNCGAKMMED